MHDFYARKNYLTYIKERVLSANNLIKNIDLRQTTLQNLINILIDAQYEFFRSGVLFLKPLTMKQVADKIGVHETTVSRAVSNKYVDSPQGIFPLKYFFSSGYKYEDGDSVANKGIMEKIRKIINSEEVEHPYSDEDIVEILKKDNVIIARRTVAKYREEMKIPSSRLRKEYI